MNASMWKRCAIGVAAGASLALHGTGCGQGNGFEEVEGRSQGALHGDADAGPGDCGEPVGPPVDLGDGADATPAVASNGSNYLVLWEWEASDGDTDLRAAYLDLQGHVIGQPDEPVVAGDDRDRAPQLASDGDGYLATWLHGEVGEVQVMTAPLPAEPEAAVPVSPFVLDSGFSGDEGGVRCSVVASDGEAHALHWSAGGFLQRARMSGDGEVIAPPVESWGPLVDCPAVASNGDDFLVGWDDATVPINVRIMPSPPPVRVSDAEGGRARPRLASSGDEYMVVWEDFRNGARDVYGGRVDADGERLDGDGLAIATGELTRPDAAGGPEGYLVAWRVSTGSVLGPHPELRAARIAPDGTVAPDFRVATGDDLHGHAVARGTEGRHLVVYSETLEAGETRIVARALCTETDGSGPGDGPPLPPAHCSGGSGKCSAEAPMGPGGAAGALLGLVAVVLGVRRRAGTGQR
ncbi:MAG: hypothetical protein ACODAU_08920 [Myxococcota bacterium]